MIYVAGKAFIESDISIESARFIGEAVVIHPDPYRDISLAWYGQVVTTRRLGTNSVEVVLSNGMVFTVDSRKARVLVPDQTGASSNVLNLDPFRQKQTDN